MIRSIGATLLLCLFSATSIAVDFLPNGDFEAGFLIGWTISEQRDGIADIVEQGNCFSEEDTTHIQLSGNYAAILSSGESARRSSVGILTSDSFNAGDGIMFTSLTGTRDGRKTIKPVEFEVRILNSNDDVLTAHSYLTSVVRLHQGCPSEPRDGRFFVHYIDTTRFLNQSIKIQFRQNTNTRNSQPFTLIDQVLLFPAGEGPLFASKPVAKAGISSTKRGDLRLDATRSFDPDSGPDILRHSWQIDGETRIRYGDRPCIADLPNGSYSATLFANDGFHVVSDRLNFLVRDNPTASGNNSSSNNILISRQGCDEEQVDTESSVDNGTDALVIVDTVAEGDEVDQENQNNTAPTLDLDEDDTTVSGNNFITDFSILSGDPISIVDTDISIMDDDFDDNIESATITFVDAQLGDTFVLDTNNIPSGVTVIADNDSVSLTGTASSSDYQQAILAVQFDNVQADPTLDPPRTIRIVVSDGTADSNPGFTTIFVDD